MNKLIVILGDLAVGKSTLAKKLANYYRIPYYTKDKLKEDLADIIGFNNREENKKLSIAAVNSMMEFFVNYSITNYDLILEANFHLAEINKLSSLAISNNYKLVLINVTGDIDLLYQKFKYRMENENRHKAHLTADIIEYDKYKKYILDSRNELSSLKLNTIYFNDDYDFVFNESIKLIDSL